MANVEKAVPAGPGPFLVGASISYADVAWFQFLLDYLDGAGYKGEKEAVAALLPTLPRLGQSCKIRVPSDRIIRIFERSEFG